MNISLDRYPLRGLGRPPSATTAFAAWTPLGPAAVPRGSRLSWGGIVEIVRQLESLRVQAAAREVQLKQLREDNERLRQAAQHTDWLRGL